MSRLHIEAHVIDRIGWLRASILGTRAGGAPVGKGVLRVTFWGAVAMAATAAIGSQFGTTAG